MQARNQQLTQIIAGNKQFIIPVFQRDYSWETEQCEQMWCDIQRASRLLGDTGHFMGSIVYVGTGAPGAVFNSFLVIDGQQRLTTLILLLTALRDHIKDENWIGGEDSPSVHRIDANYLKNPPETGSRVYKLALRRHDNETLKALIDNKPTEMDRSGLVATAYDWFRDKLKDSDPDSVYRGVGRLTVVDVTLDRSIDNPQLIFESLNSTGVDLTQSDLIRNFLLMGLPDSEQVELYEGYWQRIESLFRKANRTPDSFLRDYVALKTRGTRQIPAAGIYDAFKTFTAKETATLQDMLREMVRYARYYVALRGAVGAFSKRISDGMRNICALSTAHMLVGMRLCHCHEERKSLTETEFSQALRLIESYLVRRGVLGLQGRDYWTTFAHMAHSIDEAQPLETLRAELARRRHRHFPPNDRFQSALQEENIYWRHSLCWHVLAQLENAQHENAPSSLGEYSIEHIMPQHIENVREWQDMLGEDWNETHHTWLHRLGNLTLTGYNGELSNRSFAEKREHDKGFKNCAARLNRYVRDQVAWTEDQMRERGQELAKRALEVWPYHNANVDLIREADLRELRDRAPGEARIVSE